MQSSTVTVDVSATAQTLNLTDATIGNSVDKSTIQALPMDGRDPVSLLSLQPGVLFGESAPRKTAPNRQPPGLGFGRDPTRATLPWTASTTTTR